MHYSLNIHKKKHGDLEKVICDHCGGKFASKYKLKEHVDAVHLKLKSFKCTLCDWRTGYTTNVSLHLKKVHGVVHTLGRGRKRNLVTKEDVVKSAAIANKNEGILMKSDDGVQQKSEPVEVPSPKKDVRNVDGEELSHACDSCDKMFPERYHLQVHVTSVHLKILRYKCADCKFAAAYSTVLKSHRDTFHGGAPGTETKTKVCEICSYTTETDHYLKKHLKTVHGFDSDDVGCKSKASHEGEWQRFKSFWRASKSIFDDDALNVDSPVEDDFIAYFDHLYHEKKYKKNGLWQKLWKLDGYFKMERGKNLREIYPRLIHNFNSYAHDKVEKVKAHLCDLCDTVCRSQGDLNAHIAAKHLKMKPHKCDECDYSSAQPRNVRRHKRKMHGPNARKYNCDLCDFVSPRKNDLVKHKRVAHLNCRHCSFTTMASSALTANQELNGHISDMHPQEQKALESSTKDAYENAWSCFKRYCDGVLHPSEKGKAKYGRSLVCDDCDFATDLPQRLAEHVQKPHDKSCDKCDYATPSRDMLDWHTKGNTRVERDTFHMFKCKQCAFAANLANSLLEHVQIMGHNQYPFVECSKCKKELFVSDLSYLSEKCITRVKRMSRDTKKRCPFKKSDTKTLTDNPGSCDQCEFATSRWRELKRHKELVHEQTAKGGEDDFLGYLEYLFYGRRLKVSSILSTFPRLNHTFQMRNAGKRLEEAHPEVVSFLNKIKNDVDNQHSCDQCAYTTVCTNALARHIRSVHENEKEPHVLRPQTKVKYEQTWTTFEKFCDTIGSFDFPGEEEFILYLDHLLTDKQCKMTSAASIFSRLNNALQTDHGVKMQDAYPRLMDRLRGGGTELSEMSVLEDSNQEGGKHLEEGEAKVPLMMQLEATENHCKIDQDQHTENSDGRQNSANDKEGDEPLSMFLSKMVSSGSYSNQGEKHLEEEADEMLPTTQQESTDKGSDDEDQHADNTDRNHDPAIGKDEDANSESDSEEGDKHLEEAEDKILPEMQQEGSEKVNEDDHNKEANKSDWSQKADVGIDECDPVSMYLSEMAKFCGDGLYVEGKMDEGIGRADLTPFKNEILLKVESKERSEDEVGPEGNVPDVISLNGSEGGDQEVDPVTMYLREMEKYCHKPGIFEEACENPKKRKFTEKLDENDLLASKKPRYFNCLEKERERGEGVDTKLMKDQCIDSDRMAEEKSSSCNDLQEEATCHDDSETNSKEGGDVQFSDHSPSEEIVKSDADDQKLDIEGNDQDRPDGSDPVSMYLLEIGKCHQHVEEKKGKPIELRDDVGDFDKLRKANLAKIELDLEKAKLARQKTGYYPLGYVWGTGFACKECDFTTKDEHIFAQHEEQPHDKSCDRCRYAAPSQNLLDLHIKSRHVESETKSELKEENRRNDGMAVTEPLRDILPTAPTTTEQVCKGCGWKGKLLGVHLHRVKTKEKCKLFYDMSEVLSGRKGDAKDSNIDKEVDHVKCDICGNSYKGANGLRAHLSQNKTGCLQKLQEQLGRKDVYPLLGRHPTNNSGGRWKLFLKFCDERSKKEPGEAEFVEYFKEMFEEGKKLATIKSTLSSLKMEYQEQFGKNLQIAFPNLMPLIRKLEKKARLACDKCGFATPSPEALARHKQRPHDKCCGLCEYSAPNQDMLEKHVRASHAKKLFCDQCLFSTTDRHQLRRHVREGSHMT